MCVYVCVCMHKNMKTKKKCFIGCIYSISVRIFVFCFTFSFFIKKSWRVFSLSLSLSLSCSLSCTLYLIYIYIYIYKERRREKRRVRERERQRERDTNSYIERYMTGKRLGSRIKTWTIRVHICPFLFSIITWITCQRAILIDMHLYFPSNQSFGEILEKYRAE